MKTIKVASLFKFLTKEKPMISYTLLNALLKDIFDTK